MEAGQDNLRRQGLGSYQSVPNTLMKRVRLSKYAKLNPATPNAATINIIPPFGKTLLNKEKFWKSAPVFATFQTFTDTGIPRLVILCSADTLIHSSVFCCGHARAFMVLPKMRL